MARVLDARMEAWTPEGDLLVSEPDNGKIAQLRPDVVGTATAATLLAGLTYPQGMAFAKLNGTWVLYVAESDQIDRYPWRAGRISGPDGALYVSDDTAGAIYRLARAA
jgi:sugar lactone lactonase YvrE